MQGILDPVTRGMVQSMLDEPYAYDNAGKAFLKPTKEEREKEARQKMWEKAVVKHNEGFEKLPMEVQTSMAHMMKENQLIIELLINQSVPQMPPGSTVLTPRTRSVFSPTLTAHQEEESETTTGGNTGDSSSEQIKSYILTCYNCSQ